MIRSKEVILSGSDRLVVLINSSVIGQRAAVFDKISWAE